MKECLRVAVAAVAALGIIYLLYQYLAAPRAFTVVHPPVLHVLKEEYNVWPPFISRLPHSQVFLHQYLSLLSGQY